MIMNVVFNPSFFRYIVIPVVSVIRILLILWIIYGTFWTIYWNFIDDPPPKLKNMWIEIIILAVSIIADISLWMVHG